MIVLSATDRNVTSTAPSTGPQKVPMPPMNVISNTLPDASAPMLPEVTISSFNAARPPATPANRPLRANTSQRMRAGL